MICCKCSEKTELDPKTPGAGVCDTCCHSECHNCDHENGDEIEKIEEFEEIEEIEEMSE
jgi:hypothetical protein